MKQKGLGRGLDAIFGTDGLDLKAKPMSEMTELAIDKISPNPTQPRTAFDEEALDELAEELDTNEQLPFHFSLFTFMHWRRKWQPTPVFLPGESQGWGSLVGCHL